MNFAQRFTERQKFRKLSKTSSETHSDFAFRLKTAFQRLLQSLNAYENLELVKEVFLMNTVFGYNVCRPETAVN